MANAVSNFRSSAAAGKQSHLPPKGPFPTMRSSYADQQSFSHVLGPKSIPKAKEGQRHQRTSSESCIIDEQPSWLDELLDEPDTPVRKGAHRRSSSDSFAYVDVASFYSLDSLARESWESEEFNHLSCTQRSAYYAEQSAIGTGRGKIWESTMIMLACQNSLPSPEGKNTSQDANVACDLEKDGCGQDSSEKKEVANARTSQSKMDSKRAKQQYAQRSRVRKLQYIAELERNVQALQAQGLGFSAELEFLDQQSLILSLENKALKQRSDSLAQEQLIKHLQQEMLECEIARLRALYLQQHQQQPQQQHTSAHGRTNSRDLDSQFSSLSLKSTKAFAARDQMAGSIHI